MKVHKLAYIISLVVLATIPARSLTITWTNVANGNWNNAANWSPNLVPSTNDIAVITNAVTVSFNINTTVGGITVGADANCGGGTILQMNDSFTLNGPLVIGSCGSFTVVNGTTLTGTTNATLSGVIGWTGGLLAGTLTVAANGRLNIAGSGDNDLPNCTLTNYGTVAWSGGHIRVNGSTVINNQGLWDCQGDFTLDNNGYTGNGTFINAATFRKSVGIATSATVIGGNGSEVTFNQIGGVVDGQQGELSWQGDGNFTGGYLTTNSTGVMVLSAGNFTINGTVTSSNVWESNANLVGVNVINGGLNWIGGVWTGATVTIASNSLVTIAGAGGMFQDGEKVTFAGVNSLPNCTLTNFGTVAWSSGHIQVSGGTVINNQGLWDCQGDFNLDNNSFTGNGTFINAGTFRKSVGIATSATVIGGNGSEVTFNQIGGVVDGQQGELSWQGGGNFTGGYLTTNSTGVMVLSAGNFTINGTVTSSNVWETAANLVGVNAINGGLNWTGGVWTGATVTIASNSLVTIAGAGGMFQDGEKVTFAGVNSLPNCTLTNYGTVAWSSGHIQVGQGTVINNQGLWDCQVDQLLDNTEFGGAAMFINSGTFLKSASSGGSSQFGSAINFTNSGTIDSSSGTILLSGAFANPVGTLAVSNSAKILFAQPVILPAGLVTGFGTVQAPSVTSSGIVSPGATNAVLTIAGNYTQLLSGRMQFDIAGTSPGTNQSQVKVTGTATLSGVISLRFDSGYLPAINSSNVVLTAGTVTGKFPFVDHSFLLGQNERMIVSYSHTNVVLSAVSPPDPAGPPLSAAVKNQTFAVFFPSEFSGYQLYNKTNLTDPVWTLLPGVTNIYVESPLANSNEYFLLIHP